MAIQLSDVEHLAGLARIAVSDSEKEVLRKDLEDILAYVSQVTAVTAEMGAPVAGELYNVMRGDEGAHEGGIFTEDILSQAPAREGNRLSVKKIL